MGLFRKKEFRDLTQQQPVQQPQQIQPLVQPVQEQYQAPMQLSPQKFDEIIQALDNSIRWQQHAIRLLKE